MFSFPSVRSVLTSAALARQAATLMAGVSRPSALPFTTRLHEGRLDRMAVWDPRDAAALRLLLSQFDLVGACAGGDLQGAVLTRRCLRASQRPWRASTKRSRW